MTGLPRSSFPYPSAAATQSESPAMTDHPHPQAPFVVLRGDAAMDTPISGALKGAVVGIGNFDGVHRGHRAVIAAALARAKTLGRPAAALTFEPHPRSVFQPPAATLLRT